MGGDMGHRRKRVTQSLSVWVCFILLMTVAYLGCETASDDAGTLRENSGETLGTGIRAVFVLRASVPSEVESMDLTVFDPINSVILTSPIDRDVGSVTVDLPLNTLRFQVEAFRAEGESFRVAFRGCTTETISEATTVTVRIFPVDGANQKPVITPPEDQSNPEGDSLSLRVVANDPDCGTLTYSASNLPPGLSIDPPTGFISGTINAAAANSPYTVTVEVSDGTDSASTTFTWTVSSEPDVRGVYTVSGSETITGCFNPSDDGTFSASGTIDISSQVGATFTGTLSAISGPFPSTGNISGTVTINGDLSGNFDSVEPDDTQSEGTFAGTLISDTLTTTFTGSDIFGDTCSFTGTFSGTR